MHEKKEKSRLTFENTMPDALRLDSLGTNHNRTNYLDNKSLVMFSLLSTACNKAVSHEIKQRKLLTHVVLGEQKEAETMIKANPGLLYFRTSAVDYSGRTIMATAFQAAVGAGDKPMWEMMLPYFDGLEAGEAFRQFEEQFPKGIKDDVSAKELKDYYNAIASAIINDEDNGQSAIETFRKELTSQNEIKQGKHCNLQHLVAAYQAYIDNFDALANWDNRDLFWQKVIGYVHRQMTAYDAQVLCSGIDDGCEFLRTFDFHNGGKFFPLSADSGLGFDCGCYSYTFASSNSRLSPCHSKWSAGVRMFIGRENYVSRKQAHLKALKSRLNKECTINPINLDTIQPPNLG